LLSVFSALCAAVLLYPPESGYATPISVLVFQRSFLGWSCIGLMILTCAYFAARLWARNQVPSALGAICICAALATIATTNPYSDNHLLTFVGLAIFVLAWHWWFHSLEAGAFSFLTALGVTLGVLTCFGSLGVGERVIALSSLLTVNWIFLDYLA